MLCHNLLWLPKYPHKEILGLQYFLLFHIDNIDYDISIIKVSPLGFINIPHHIVVHLSHYQFAIVHSNLLVLLRCFVLFVGIQWV